MLVGRTLYGETQPDPETSNMRGKVVQLFDQAGVVTSDEYDFKGNLLRNQRQLAIEYKTTLNWAAVVPLEAETFVSRTGYDALNRPTELTAPDNSVIRPTYNEANLLERVEANLRGAAVPTPFIFDIDYDAKGQRTLIDYGNGVRTTYEYDPLTFRLIHLLTRRDAVAFLNDCPQPPPAGWPGCQVQNVRYTHDPIGNITDIRDDAQQTIYFRNRRVEPSAEYTYDAIYRLIEATGREHLGQVGRAPIPHSHDDVAHVGLLHPGDGNAMGTYIERYVYDAVGNFLEMQHRGSDPAHAGWTRTYTYNEASLIEPAKQSNRLSSTTVGGNNPPVVEPYTYDGHGNMTIMPHLPLMQWDYRDHLQATTQQLVNNAGTPETTWYFYDAAGQRVRKVTERQNGTRRKERIYLGGLELYREYNGSGSTVTLERETLHIMEDKQRIALVETRTQGNDPTPEQLIRYQLGNHLGSAALELDEQAQIISYEEHYPYGSTSYQAVRSQTETPKRYRYTGKERDEETGLSYHGARYYVAWLGRWISTDPAGLRDGPNSYYYGKNNPINLVDLSGTSCGPTKALCPTLMDNWSYATPVPDRGSVGHNVQRDHPIQVSLRREQRHGAYNRDVSASRGELTVLVETGKGRFHTEVGRLQARINELVRSGVIKSESQLIEATRDAYRLAAKLSGVKVNPQALDRAIVSNLATLSVTAKQTAIELRQAGVKPSDFPSDSSFDRAFSDPDAPRRPATSQAAAQAPSPRPAPSQNSGPSGRAKAGSFAKGSVKALAPGIALGFLDHMAQANDAAAAHDRDNYQEPPSEDQIERQREVGFEYMGMEGGKPMWSFNPDFDVRFREVIRILINPEHVLRYQAVEPLIDGRPSGVI